jgi:hypothetical protein
MRRSVLLTIAALGGLVCLLGGTVLVSALQDTARTGTASIESAALESSADIQLSQATGNGTSVSCLEFSENLATAPMAVQSFRTGSMAGDFFCIRNVGSQSVTLTALAEELTDVDLACTGDEAQSGDATCGGDQAGELAGVLHIGFVSAPCATFVDSFSTVTLSELATTPAPLGSLAAGATGCFAHRVLIPADTTSNVAAQKAQSDRVTWKFRFTAQA